MGVSAQNVTDLHGREQDSFISAPETILFLKSGDQIGFGFYHSRETLDQPFEIADGVIVPPGDYESGNYYLSFLAAASRPLSGLLNVGGGGRYSGHYLYSIASLTWRPSSRMSTTATHISTITRLPEGDFEADVYRYRLDLSYSPRLSWNNLVQYDNFSQQLGWFSRIRWTLEPDNDVFLVMSKRMQRDTESHDFSTASTDLAAKVGWTFRY